MAVEQPSYTVLLVPKGSGAIHRLRFNLRRLRWLGLALVSFVALWCSVAVHYVFIVHEAGQNTVLRHENFELSTRLKAMSDEIVRIDSSLQRINEIALRVRAMTALHDSARNLSRTFLVGNANKTPEVLYAKGERIDYEDEAIDSKLALRMVDGRLSLLANQSAQTEDKMKQLQAYLDEHGEVLGSTPSLRPTLSRLIISRFGPRTDPYTDMEVMHKGIDYAAELGTLVRAPADGIVVFAGMRGSGTGNTVIIDHGFGLQTHYSHLGHFHVKPKTPVQRGETIAEVGDSGRSTGSHLHYEVRFNGIPQDPETFILDER